jgi:N6-adenosine-specific RNA methylase IME4
MDDRADKKLTALTGTILDADAARANQVHGAINEGLHGASYLLERVFQAIEGQLKDGSWRNCGPGYDNLNDYAASLNFGELKVVAKDRRKLVEIFREHAPEVSTRTLAKVLGVTHSTVVRDAPKHDGNPSSINKGVVHDAPKALTGRQAACLVDRRVNGRAERLAQMRADECKVLALRPRPGKFRTIVLDPAWDYGHGDTGMGYAGRARPHYALQTFDELLTLDVRAWADEEAGCHLYCWVTNNFVGKAYELVQHWGFQYRLLLTWFKPPPFGLGSYFRHATEHVIFATLGGTTTRPAAASLATYFVAPRGEHSEKPDLFYDIVRAASYPPYGEGDQREPRPDFANLFEEVEDAESV